eukprot:365089-Chlamydomonas_euryale.AAC.9
MSWWLATMHESSNCAECASNVPGVVIENHAGLDQLCCAPAMPCAHMHAYLEAYAFVHMQP